MIFRNGEGFSETDEARLAEGLEGEIAIFGLFTDVKRRLGGFHRRTDRFWHDNDGLSSRSISQVFRPVPIIHPNGFSQEVTLSDRTVVTQDTLGDIQSISIVWRPKVVVREDGRKIETLERPALATWHFVDGTKPVVDWYFIEPDDVQQMVTGGPALLEQDVAIYRLQQVLSQLLADSRPA